MLRKFKEAVKDKKKKDAEYTDFEEIYRKGGKTLRINTLKVPSKDAYIALCILREGYYDRINLDDPMPLEHFGHPQNIRMVEDTEGFAYIQAEEDFTHPKVQYLRKEFKIRGIKDYSFINGQAIPKSAFGKYAKGGNSQGYDDRENESLGERTGKESSKKQSMKDRREDSYGKWGKRDKEDRDISMAHGGTTYDKEQDELIDDNRTKVEDQRQDLDYHDDRIDENQRMSEEGVELGDSAWGEFEPRVDQIEDRLERNEIYEKGGVVAQDTPCCGTIRTDFYNGETKNLTDKSGTGNDNRKNYYIDGTNVRANTEEEALKEVGITDNISTNDDNFFLTNEEVYVDFTNEEGEKIKKYIVVNNPDEAVRLLQSRYKATSIEGMTMKWELEDKGLEGDKYKN